MIKQLLGTLGYRGGKQKCIVITTIFPSFAYGLDIRKFPANHIQRYQSQRRRDLFIFKSLDAHDQGLQNNKNLLENVPLNRVQQFAAIKLAIFLPKFFIEILSVLRKLIPRNQSLDKKNEMCIDGQFAVPPDS